MVVKRVNVQLIFICVKQIFFSPTQTIFCCLSWEEETLGWNHLQCSRETDFGEKRTTTALLFLVLQRTVLFSPRRNARQHSCESSSKTTRKPLSPFADISFDLFVTWTVNRLEKHSFQTTAATRIDVRLRKEIHFAQVKDETRTQWWRTRFSSVSWANESDWSVYHCASSKLKISSSAVSQHWRSIVRRNPDSSRRRFSSIDSIFSKRIRPRVEPSWTRRVLPDAL